MSNDKSFDLDEIIRFLKKGDYSIFDFYSEYTAEDAGIYTKERGFLCICNVSDNSIPEETVIQVIDVLEHLDECIEQAYDKLVYWDPVYDYWDPKNRHTKTPEKTFELVEINFGLPEFWQKSNFQEYRVPEPKTAGDVFWLEFRCDPLGYLVKFRCEDRRLCSIIPHILWS